MTFWIIQRMRNTESAFCLAWLAEELINRLPQHMLLTCSGQRTLAKESVGGKRFWKVLKTNMPEYEELSFCHLCPDRFAHGSTGLLFVKLSPLSMSLVSFSRFARHMKRDKRRMSISNEGGREKSNR